jgi:hypothetical protein
VNLLRAALACCRPDCDKAPLYSKRSFRFFPIHLQPRIVVVAPSRDQLDRADNGSCLVPRICTDTEINVDVKPERLSVAMKVIRSFIQAKIPDMNFHANSSRSDSACVVRE